MAYARARASAALLSLPQLRWSPRQIGLTLALVALLGWAALSFADGASLASAASGLWARPELLAIFLATYTAAFALRAWAWRRLLPAGPGVARLLAMLQVALLANHLFPTKAGELIRAGLLARAGVPLGVSAGSTALARLLDFAALGLIAVTFGALAGSQLLGLLALLALPLAAIGAGVIACALLATGKLAPLWSRLPAPLARLGEHAQQSLTAASPRHLLTAFAIVVPSWLLEGGAVWTVAQAAGVPLSLQAAAAATAFTIAFQAFQVTPGGLGLYEASLTAALALYGVPPAAGLSLAVATHALKFAYAYAVGIPCLVAESLHWRRDSAATRPGAASPGGSAARHLRGLASWAAPLLWVAALVALLPFALARLWWQARRPLPPPAPVSPGSRLAVVIPVHNEAATVGAVVAGVPRQALRRLGVETEVIVVDDGSSDGSAELARAAGADLLVRHATRRGLGAAVRAGLQTARQRGAAAAVYLDGDGEYDPADLPAVALPVLAGQADYVLGTRFPDAARVMRPSRRWGNLALTWLLRGLTGRWLGDGQTGYRAFSGRALEWAEIVHDYNYAQVLTLDLLRKRARLAEVPIRYRLRESGASFIRYREYLGRVLPAIAREVLGP